MAFAGCVISDDDGETEASTSGPSTMSTTNSMTSTAGDDSGTMGMTTAPGTGDDTAGDTADDTAGDTAVTAGDTGPGGDPTEACLAACEVAAGCEKFPPEDCPASCEEDIGFAEEDGCVDVAIPWWQCISALDCSMYQMWLDSDGDPYPCQAEDEAVFACGAGGDSSSGGADSSSGG